MNSLALFLPRDILCLLESTTDTASKNIGSDFLSSALQMLYLVLVFAFVLFLAYYGTKLLAGSRNYRRGTNIELIEAMSVGFQSSVQLVRVGSKYVLIGVTKDKVVCLTEIDQNIIDLSPDKVIQKPMTLDDYVKRFIKPKKTE